jgi:hypothetical protein
MGKKRLLCEMGEGAKMLNIQNQQKSITIMCFSRCNVKYIMFRG